MVIPLVAPQAVAFVLVFAAVQAMQSGALDRSGGESAGIVWGDRTHASRGDLAAWLASRGTSYDVWAARHPEAAARLTREQRTSGDLPRLAAPAVERGTLLAGAAALVSACLLTATAIAGRRLHGSRERRRRSPQTAPPRAADAAAPRPSRVAAPDAALAARVAPAGGGQFAVLRFAALATGGQMPAAARVARHLRYVWRRHRLEIVFWTAGLAASVMTGVLAGQLL